MLSLSLVSMDTYIAIVTVVVIQHGDQCPRAHAVLVVGIVKVGRVADP